MLPRLEFCSYIILLEVCENPKYRVGNTTFFFLGLGRVPKFRDSLSGTRPDFFEIFIGILGKIGIPERVGKGLGISLNNS